MGQHDLDRSLGLYPTMMISMGAMIGSGIFVLPALGYKKAGPAVILAYVLAALVVLPAALSKAEMATAMPESGGTYLYIDRALGPLFGTIAGVGAWFSLVFKSSFALVGLGAYLLLFAPLSQGAVVYVALALAVLVVALNVSGTKMSGGIQAVIVTLVVAGLLAYVVNAGFAIDAAKYTPFSTDGNRGVITAAAFVFVSYAGVTKIASVAEEVKDPGKNLPRAMLGSMAVMTVLYIAVVGAIIGLSDPNVLKTGGPGGTASLTPMADGAGALLGGAGVLFISVIAVVALTSMANAGVLSSSRFPLAMSRDDLLPPALQTIDSRFKTPRNSVLLTGLVLVLLIAFVPVIELAKLASAFQILVFSIINVSLIAFREADLPAYQPEFTAPGYPFVQLFGFVAGIALLTQMGTVPILGAVAIIFGSALVYFAYGRPRTDRTGAIGTILRARRGEEDDGIASTEPK
ncbi:amino acid transporter [Halorubrum sp. Ib24]|uniref:APC family permease n=1 Tax=unclassified Halorubrum TaxID=2642239 RepID=UPI000B993C49|nr:MULTISPECIES: APC family permease [unclassified Halorubrum]OYR38023.1 amino acid transporter [Halorubrum sp. Ib24]OYR42239.1 amino acid transporter [Halorubrum sp. Hd13]OYR45002.1 amino acid transporter [Halorubrum sp. Ea8]OYR50015.1 amino acid transporter [Halorubrum sp. Eb13]